jgi:hypothetical protein
MSNTVAQHHKKLCVQEVSLQACCSGAAAFQDVLNAMQLHQQ